MDEQVPYVACARKGTVEALLWRFYVANVGERHTQPVCEYLSQGIATGKCGRCVGGAQEATTSPNGELVVQEENTTAAWSDILQLGRAAAFIAQANAAGTDTTYTSSRRRFVRVIQDFGLQSGVHIPEAEIFPSAPGKPVPRNFVLGFIAAAAFHFATGKIEGTLTAVRHWHLEKGRGKLPSPTDGFDVRHTMDGVRASHAGTTFGVQKAALAICPGVLQFLVDVGDYMVERALARQDFRLAYGYARDLVWYVISFLACLRREEAAAL